MRPSSLPAPAARPAGWRGEGGDAERGLWSEEPPPPSPPGGADGLDPSRAACLPGEAAQGSADKQEVPQGCELLTGRLASTCSPLPSRPQTYLI